MAGASPFTPAVFYQDPKAALQWLEIAFGFETTMVVSDDAGAVAHAEMSFGGGHVTIGGEWGSPELLGPAVMKSPASLGGQGTQFIRVTLQEGLDAHCIRAEAAGARIVQRPEDQFYGARTYRALDPEGHVWSFDQAIETPAIEEMEAASGLTITTALAR
jgi:uncharacterized glyoxalase superfamily protein PhnB